MGKLVGHATKTKSQNCFVVEEEGTTKTRAQLAFSPENRPKSPPGPTCCCWLLANISDRSDGKVFASQYAKKHEDRISETFWTVGLCVCVCVRVPPVPFSKNTVLQNVLQHWTPRLLVEYYVILVKEPMRARHKGSAPSRTTKFHLFLADAPQPISWSTKNFTVTESHTIRCSWRSLDSAGVINTTIYLIPISRE